MVYCYAMPPIPDHVFIDTDTYSLLYLILKISFNVSTKQFLVYSLSLPSNILIFLLHYAEKK